MLRSADRSCRSHDRVRRRRGTVCLSVCRPHKKERKPPIDKLAFFFGVNELEERVYVSAFTALPSNDNDTAAPWMH